MRILQFVIPFHQRAVFGVAPHQLDRLRYNIDIFRAADRDAVLGLESKDAFHFRARFAHNSGKLTASLQFSGARDHQMTPDDARDRKSDIGFTGAILTTFSGS